MSTAPESATGPLILASGSASRARMLKAAGVDVEIVRPPIDEEALKETLRVQDVSPVGQAMRLAEAKALSVSRQRQGLVIGADQMLVMDVIVFDKPKDLDEARAQLAMLSGRTHHLVSACVVARGDSILWRQLTRPELKMRTLSPAFIDAYLAQTGDDALTSVGAYKLEGLGGQLFEAVDGDFFSVLGLPLLPLLGFLRDQGAIPA